MTEQKRAWAWVDPITEQSDAAPLEGIPSEPLDLADVEFDFSPYDPGYPTTWDEPGEPPWPASVAMLLPNTYDIVTLFTVKTPLIITGEAHPEYGVPGGFGLFDVSELAERIYIALSLVRGVSTDDLRKMLAEKDAQ